ncbi:VOC family protein [Occultella glacieicola]|uniref:VOC family protein n=1 Tax=Occultella glacieicola TaxID=2518684 RepID=A0ABY2E5R2_9MICO|nr:VOC family protein [Occultella glacieicola]TDE95930.1 VOC family protein [Occultella glacieicola]
MDPEPVLRAVDCVTIPVPDLDTGLAFYANSLGHELLWRDETTGQAGLRLPDTETELVLTATAPYAPAWLVDAVPTAVNSLVAAGATVRRPVTEIPVGRLAVVTDPFGNDLVLLDLSTGRYR